MDMTKFVASLTPDEREQLRSALHAASKPPVDLTSEEMAAWIRGDKNTAIKWHLARTGCTVRAAGQAFAAWDDWCKKN